MCLVYLCSILANIQLPEPKRNTGHRPKFSTANLPASCTKHIPMHFYRLLDMEGISFLLAFSCLAPSKKLIG